MKSERAEEWAIGWMVRLFTNTPQEEAEQGAGRAQVITKGSWKCGSGLITFHRFSAMTIRFVFSTNLSLEALHQWSSNLSLRIT